MELPCYCHGVKGDKALTGDLAPIYRLSKLEYFLSRDIDAIGLKRG